MTTTTKPQVTHRKEERMPSGYGFNPNADLAAALRRLDRLVVEGRMTGPEADRRAARIIAELQREGKD